MGKLIASFKQADYIKTHGLKEVSDGACLAIVARWAKLKAKHGISTERAFFHKPAKEGKFSTAQIIEMMQVGFEKIQGPYKRAVDRNSEIEKLLDKQITAGEMSIDEAQIFWRTLEEIAEMGAKEVKEALHLLLKRQKLIVEQELACNSFSEYFMNAKPSDCFVFRCSSLKHAYGGYVVGPAEYRFFDPNSGEYALAGLGDVNQSMAAMKEAFPKSETQRFRVSYSKNIA